MDANRVFTVKIADFSHADREVARLADFYEQHQHPATTQRDALTLLRRTRSRKVFLLENELREIRGASLTILYGGRHLESGGTRILDNGFGFQRLLNSCVSMQAFVADPPEGVFYSVVANDNAPSMYNLKKCDFVEWSPDPMFFAECGYDIANIDTGSFKFLRLYPHSLKSHAQALMTVFNSPILVNKSTGEKVSVILDFELMRNAALRSVVARVAAGFVTLPVID